MHRIVIWCLRAPRSAAALLLMVTAVLAAGLPRLSSDVGYRAFLGRDHPAVVRFEQFLQQFHEGLTIAAVFDCADSPCESALDPASLAMVRQVEARLGGTPQVRRIVTPASAGFLVPADGRVVVRQLPDSAPPGDPDAASLAARALGDPLWRGRLIGSGGQVGAIVLELRSSGGEDAVAAYAALDAALAPFEAKGFRFQRVGGPVEFVVAGGELESGTRRMVPVMVALVAAGLWWVFRSVAATAAVLAATGLAVVWTVGAMGWLGWPQNSLTQALPPLLLVIGICDGIHWMTRLGAQARIQPGRSRDELLVDTSTEVGGACLMTSLTTAAGFASFAFSDLESVARFGMVAAVGVMFALSITFTLLPLLGPWIDPLALWRGAPPAWSRSLARLSARLRPHARLILAGAFLLAVVAAPLALRVRADASFEELYGRDSQVVRWAERVGARLARPDRLEVSLSLPEGMPVSSPEALGAIRSARASLQAIPELGRVHSLLDLVEHARSLLIESGVPPPRDRFESAIADARIVRGAAESEDEVLGAWVSASGEQARLSVETGKLPQDVMAAVLDRVRGALARALPEGFSAELTGPFVLVHVMIDAIRSTQLSSFATAAVLVWLLMAIFLRSASMAVAAVCIAALPILVTLGTMALLDIPLDVGSAMVAAVVLGIGVDDLVHFLARVRVAAGRGETPSVAVEDALTSTGPALVTTSLVLAVGFSALALSPWQSIARFGLLAAVSIVGALASVLLVLPAWLQRAGPEAEASAVPPVPSTAGDPPG